ncbi:hypothetical protein OH77DRAFT_1563907, partial [Trametes cingulata]
MPSLLSLNYDVLENILSYLHGEDALNLALCCKELHELALPRVSAVAECYSPEQLRELCAYMLSGPRYPVQHLEELHIHYTTFAEEGGDPDDTPFSADDEDEDDDDDEDEVYWDFSQAHLVRDLLLHAAGLRRLTLHRVHPLLEREPLIGAALCALPRLAALELCTVAEPTFPLLARLSPGLRALHFAYSGEEDDLEDGPHSALLLLRVLAPLQRLHTLVLENFCPWPQGGAFVAPRFPALRTLTLQYVTAAALPFVDLCPNVRSVELLVDEYKPYYDCLTLPRDGRVWGRLRHLELAALWETYLVRNRLKTLDSVRVRMCALTQEERPVTSCGQARVTALFELLAATNPVSFELPVCVGWTPMTFWADVPALAPRLRILKLQVRIAALTEANACWLDNIADALSPLPLLYLSIYLPPHPFVLNTAECILHMDEDGALIPSDPELARAFAAAKRVEERRPAAVAALPQRLAAALPT